MMKAPEKEPWKQGGISTIKGGFKAEQPEQQGKQPFAGREAIPS